MTVRFQTSQLGQLALITMYPIRTCILSSSFGRFREYLHDVSCGFRATNYIVPEDNCLNRNLIISFVLEKHHPIQSLISGKRHFVKKIAFFHCHKKRSTTLINC